MGFESGPWPNKTGFYTDPRTRIEYALVRGERVGQCRASASEATRTIWRCMSWKAILERAKALDQPPDWSPIK